MFIREYYLVYPEGDTQEINGPLRFNDMVDINGNPLTLPLKTRKMIVYRIYKITKKENKGEELVFHNLELVRGEELFRLTGTY